MFTRIEFFVTETVTSLRRHPMMALAAVLCVAATLFVGGIVGLVILNANHAVHTIIDQVRFDVFFKTKLSREDAMSAYNRICTLDGVDEAKFVPKEEAWAWLDWKDKYQGDENDLPENPLPDSVIIKAKDVSAIPQLKSEIEEWEEVDSVRDAPELTSGLIKVRDGVGRIGTIVGLILALLSLVIIHHTIELTLYARRKEINIMSLVGATPATIALPFILEGIIYGLIGGLLTLASLLPLYKYFLSRMMSDYAAGGVSLPSDYLLQNPAVLTQGAIIIFLAGGILGLMGSFMSTLKYLNNPRSKLTNAY